jgi:16S rRNA (cytidine1402-2'-O)-methyltransferase
VLPLAGASSLLLALAASGLNGQSFAFVGYLPQEPDAARRLRELETLSRQRGRRSCSSRRLTATRHWPPRCWQACSRHAAVDQLRPDAGRWLDALPDSVAQWRHAPPQVSDRMPAVFAGRPDARREGTA